VKAEFADQFKAMIDGQNGRVTLVFEQVTPLMENVEGKTEIVDYHPMEVASVLLDKHVAQALIRLLASGFADHEKQKGE
jgi:hypothetical protein